MASNQIGRNAGLTGLLDIPGFGASYEVRAHKWDYRQEGRTRERRGRGGGLYRTLRWVVSSGKGTFTGKTILAAKRQPATWSAQPGTLKFRWDQGRGIDFPVLVTSLGDGFVDGKQDSPDVVGAYEITGDGTPVGWTPTTAIGPTRSDQQQWDGTARGVDPGKLLPPPTQTVIDWWDNGVSDTDAGEQQKLLAVIAAVVAPITTPHGYKVRGATIVRDAPDGGTITLVYGLTTTDEDVLNDATNRDTDPDGLTSNETTAAFNTTPPNPTIAELVLRDQTVKEHNDSMVLNARAWGETTHKQDFTFPNSPKVDDESDLEDTEQVADVQASDTPTAPTAPTGLKLIDTHRERKTNSGKYGFVFYFGRRTRQEAIEYDGSPQTIDSSSLADAIIYTRVKSSATPAPPATPDGFVLKDTEIVQRHAASTGAKWIHKYSFARTTGAKEIEFAGTRIQSLSTQNIGYESTLRVVSTEAAAPTPPTSPGSWGIVGKLIYADSQPLTTSQGTYTGYWQHTFAYGANDRLDELLNKGIAEDDPADETDTDVQYDVSAAYTSVPVTPTPKTADLKLVRRTAQRFQVTPEKWLWRFQFGRNTTRDERQHTKRNKDADSFDESERIPLVHTSGTSAPSTPSQEGTSSNLFDIEIERLCVANGSFTGLWLWTYAFRPNTRKQAIEQQGGFSIDAALLDGDDVQTLTNTSSTPPGTPAARVTNQVLYVIKVRKLQNTPQKWEFQFVFGYRTSADLLVSEKTRTGKDPALMNDRDFTAAVWLVSGGEPSDPSAPRSGLQLVDKQDVETKNPLYRLRQYEWGRLTERDKLILPHTWVNTDVSALKSEGEQARMDGESGNPSTLTAGTETLVKRGETTRQVTHPSFGNRQIFIQAYGPATPQQDEEYEKSRASVSWEDRTHEITASIVASTQPRATIAAGLFATSNTDIGVEVLRRTPTKVLTLVETQDVGKQIIPSEPHTVREAVRGVPSRAIVGGPDYVPGNILASDAHAKLLIFFNGGDLRCMPQYIWRTRGGFILQRAISATTPDAYLFLAIRGNTNNQAIWGYSQGEILYEGPLPHYELTGGRILMRWKFATDDWRWFNDGFLPEGRTAVNGTGAGVFSSGLYDAAQFEIGAGCTYPPQASFAGFTA